VERTKANASEVLARRKRTFSKSKEDQDRDLFVSLCFNFLWWRRHGIFSAVRKDLSLQKFQHVDPCLTAFGVLSSVVREGTKVDTFCVPGMSRDPMPAPCKRLEMTSHWPQLRALCQFSATGLPSTAQ